MKALIQLTLMIGLCTAIPVLALDADQPLENSEHRALYEKLMEEVRCLVCQNQTIGDSSAPLAQDLRRAIRVQIEQGRTEAEIKEFLITRYGDFVLYRPRFGGPSALLWIAPGLFLCGGLFVLWRIVRRRATLPVTTDAQDAFAPAGSDRADTNSGPA